MRRPDGSRELFLRVATAGLDEHGGITYLASMATRLLLTLLAILTGLAAQLNPAQARLRVDDAGQIGAFEAAQSGERVVSVGHRPLSQPVERPWQIIPSKAGVLRSEAIGAPRVQVGIDRARE